MYGLMIGDVISCPKEVAGTTVDHVGVVVGPNAVLHNTPARGEHVSTLADFLAGKEVDLVERLGSPNQVPGVMQRASQILASPKQWSLLYNCRDTVAKVLGRPLPTQGFIGFVAIVGGLALLMKQPSVAKGLARLVR